MDQESRTAPADRQGDVNQGFLRRNKSSLFVFGTIFSILTAGIAIQLLRPKAGLAENSNTGTSRSDERYVARVNDTLITYDDVASECMDRFGKDVLENVVNRTVIQQACASRGIQVTGAEVKQEILRISKRFGLDTASWYKMLEAERGLNPVQYQRDIIWPLLALKKLAGTEVKVTRADLKKAYDDAYGPKVRAKMIMFDNQRRAEAAWNKLQKTPDEFERLAREESIEPQSRALGGTIPPIRLHSGASDQVRKAAFKMRKPGEISGIIQVGVSRYVVLQFEGRTEPVNHRMEDVQAQLHEELIEQEVQTMVARTMKMLREKSRIDNYLTGESSRQVQQVSGSQPAGRAGTAQQAAGRATTGRATTKQPARGTTPQRRSR